MVNSGDLRHWTGVDFELLSPERVKKVIEAKGKPRKTFAREVFNKMLNTKVGEGFSIGPIVGDGQMSFDRRVLYLRGAISNLTPKLSYRSEYPSGARVFVSTLYEENGKVYLDVVRNPVKE